MANFLRGAAAAISDQLWSWIFVLTGCSMVLLTKHFGMSTDIGAGIIGAGINAFTQTTKQNNQVDHVNTMNVSAEQTVKKN